MFSPYPLVLYRQSQASINNRHVGKFVSNENVQIRVYTDISQQSLTKHLAHIRCPQKSRDDFKCLRGLCLGNVNILYHFVYIEIRLCTKLLHIV